MSDRPYLHGGDHGPGGIDPVPPGAWLYAAAAATAWSSGTAYAAGAIVSHDVFNYRAFVASTGVEPGVTSGWPSYWLIYQLIFQNGWTNMAATAGTPEPVPMRIGIVLGNLNTLDRATGAITQYRDKRIDVEGDVMGGADGTTVIWVPPAYRKEYDIPLHAHDDNQAYIAGRVYSAGNIVLGVA